MCEENKKDAQNTMQAQEPQTQETQKQETSLSEQELKEVSGGMTYSQIKFEYKPQKPDGTLD